MRSQKRINSRAKSLSNTGLGTDPLHYGKRFFNKDGFANIEKKGLSYFEGISWYHTMLNMPRWRFMIVIFAFFIGMNLLFATLYFIIGIENINGIAKSKNVLFQFGQAYFFSTQTFTTVGYGHMSPKGFWASSLSSAEALVGLLSFAIATGMFFGRFSKPSIFLKFSENAIIAPYKEETAFMFRLAPYKNTNYIDAEVSVTLGITTEEDGVLSNKFYALDLEMSKINTLTLSWTLVHPITEDSPLYNYSEKEFAENKGEILVIVRAFDDMFSTMVTTRTSYIFNEVVYGAKYIQMFNRDLNNHKTELDFDKLNSIERVSLE
jgi:inward rectifier potassium channel